MPKCVCSGTKLKCSFGLSFGSLNVMSQTKVSDVAMIATIMDNKPMNIGNFGMCQSMSNPSVASATAAASGVLTPQPCFPNVIAPWTFGSLKVQISSYPALQDKSKLNCSYGGIIEILAIPPIPKTNL